MKKRSKLEMKQIGEVRRKFVELQPILEKAKSQLEEIYRQSAQEIKSKELVRVRLSGIRIKNLNRLVKKARDKKIAIKDALTQVSDIVGMRIICDNLADMKRFAQIMKEQLTHSNCPNVSDYVEEPLSTGYRALHIDVMLNIYSDDASPIPASLIPERIPCEIQIQTLLQNSWATLSHDDVYKSGCDIPEDLQARMHDLAEILAAADRIAQNIRDRIERAYSGDPSVTLDEVSLDGIALVFERIFGRPPGEYSARIANNSLMEHGTESLHGLETVLADSNYVEELRNAYQNETGFGLPPSKEQVLISAAVAASRDEGAGLRDIERQAREERDEIDTFWRNEFPSKLPDSYSEFLECIREINLDEVAIELGVSDKCSVCGEFIVEAYSLAEGLCHHYGIDNSEGVFSAVVRENASWCSPESENLCGYHGHVMSKDD